MKGVGAESLSKDEKKELSRLRDELEALNKTAEKKVTQSMVA
jgi:hypothetical protein